MRWKYRTHPAGTAIASPLQGTRPVPRQQVTRHVMPGQGRRDQRPAKPCSVQVLRFMRTTSRILRLATRISGAT